MGDRHVGKGEQRAEFGGADPGGQAGADPGGDLEAIQQAIPALEEQLRVGVPRLRALERDGERELRPELDAAALAEEVARGERALEGCTLWHTVAVEPEGRISAPSSADHTTGPTSPPPTRYGLPRTAPSVTYAPVPVGAQKSPPRASWNGDASSPSRRDGDECTQEDQCLSGICSGGSPVVCFALDTCHDAGVCDPATGLCDDPPRVDGSPCFDADPCTQDDACVAGVCGGTKVVCPAPDVCQQPGTCEPATGVCTYAPKTDGACSDATELIGGGCTCASAGRATPPGPGWLALLLVLPLLRRRARGASPARLTAPRQNVGGAGGAGGAARSARRSSTPASPSSPAHARGGARNQARNRSSFGR